MTKEEAISFLNQGKELILKSEKITFYMYKNIIYMFKEDKHGNGITLGALDIEKENRWDQLELKDEDN